MTSITEENGYYALTQRLYNMYIFLKYTHAVPNSWRHGEINTFQYTLGNYFINTLVDVSDTLAFVVIWYLSTWPISFSITSPALWHIAGLEVNYGISNTIVLEIP